MAVAIQPIVDPETTVCAAVRQYGSEYEVPELISVISKRTGLPERVVRGVVWDLLAERKLVLSGRSIKTVG